MTKLLKQLGLSKVANSYVNRLDQAKKLREIANRSNYTYKVKVLWERVSSEYDFWNQKENPSEQKLADVDRDLIFIESQINQSEFNKERIDLLMSKYGCN